jgi:hypothetical protein
MYEPSAMHMVVMATLRLEFATMLACIMSTLLT